jgi:prepilin-type N-terminal cleavage/methylation domain-containing protein
MMKAFNRRFKTQAGYYISGFTMVEIIVVILIISILISVAVPSFLSIINQVSCRAELNLIDFEVEREETVSGKIKGCEPFRKSHELKFYVCAIGKSNYQYYYFPISVKGQDWKSQNWESSVTFGANHDSGSVFKGGVVLTDPKYPKWSNYDADNGRDSLIGKRISANDFLRK